MEQRLAERGVPTQLGTKQNAKSHQRPGEPGAPQTGLKESERLSRTSLETFPLRQGRNDESPILGYRDRKTRSAHFDIFGSNVSTPPHARTA
jgi:hypothetical protein